jgi:hypothetical protein
MGIWRNLERLFDGLSPTLRLVIAAALVAFSLASIYGRINTRCGAKIFSKVPEQEIRSNRWHPVRYTVIPVLVTAGFLSLLATRGIEPSANGAAGPGATSQQTP